MGGASGRSAVIARCRVRGDAGIGLLVPAGRRFGGLVIPVKKDQAANRAKLGSAGGRPPAFDRERYKERNTIELREQTLHDPVI
jgi:hypothetical protein